jgi:WD40 repeat protein
LGFSLSSSGHYFLRKYLNSFQIWETENLTLEQETEENFGSAILCDSTFSPDDKMIFFLSGNKVKIFEKGNDKYELLQEIEDSSATLRRVSISQKGSLFAVSEISEGKLWIYKK